ncbi:MAG: hypothetical protein K8R64_06795 [Methanosarcinaceae archaeon]|nr:hypothetical protein [Methanosarcinaceae archaeon]
MDLKAVLKNQNVLKKRSGYMWAMTATILWGLWYLPGSVLWVLDPFATMYGDIAVESGDVAALLVTAVLITAFNALAVVVVLTIWNGSLGKLGELKRTMREIHPCTKWFFAASIFGGPVAILGSFIAMGFVGAAFAAVAALLYPVVGTILANRWYGEKITKRALVGMFFMICGGIVIFGAGITGELGASVPLIGIIGGLMIPIGWGVEGAIAGKGLDVAEPDAALHLRFISETAIWWVIVIPILALVGFPMYTYALAFFDPLVMMVMFFAGLAFGYEYVCWYKSFPLIGIARAQGITILYVVVVVVALYLFFGSVPDSSLLIGGALGIAGAAVMFSEDVTEEESIRT